MRTSMTCPPPCCRRRLAALATHLQPEAGRDVAVGVRPRCVTTTAGCAHGAWQQQKEDIDGPLSAADLEQFHRDGWVLVKAAASRSDAERVRAEMFRCMEFGYPANEGASRSWYDTSGKPTPIHHAVPMRQTQAQWDVLQSPRVHGAFAQLYGTHKLWCNYDGVCTIKPPYSPDTATNVPYPHVSHDESGETFSLGRELPMHWDVSPEQFQADGYKFGTVSFMFLNDRDETGGQTAIVPGFHRHFNTFSTLPGLAQEEIERMKAPSTRHHPDIERVLEAMAPIERMEVKVIPGEAGDLLIFDSFLPHGSGLNTSGTPRATMWVSCGPLPAEDTAGTREKQRQGRIVDWETQMQGRGVWVPPDELGKPADLSTLGRRLLGVDEWPEQWTVGLE